MQNRVSVTNEPPVLEVSHLSKRFCRDLRRSLYYAVADIAGELIARTGSESSMTLRPGEFAALDDVSFELRPGESLAIVGKNGAGKTTLLKLIYGLIKPDAGEVRARGRVGALIELGTGFNDVLTGRENISINATLLGYSGPALSRLRKTIIDFAELEDVIDTPVRYYSSGMRARLAFAIAAHLEPDVLLVDEVLAVGDMAFQRKCALHIRQFLAQGGALIFVSHSPFQAQALCQRAILLEGGKCIFAGSAIETIARYFARSQEAGVPDDFSSALAAQRQPVSIDAVRAESDQGATIRPEGSLGLVVRYSSDIAAEVIWGFTIWTGDHWVCVTGGTSPEPEPLLRGSGELSCWVPRLPLLAGTYTIRVMILDAYTLQPLALRGWEDAPVPLLVEGRPSLVANIGSEVNQLVSLDVDWAHSRSQALPTNPAS